MLLRLTKYLLYATAFTPILVYNKVIFPFVFLKMVFFRAAVALALVLFLVTLIFKFKLLTTHYSLLTTKFKNLIRNPIFIFVLLFIISLAVSTILAENSYRAFWGDVERAEGLFGILHYFVFMVLAAVVFERRDWINFFKISLAAGAYVIFFGLLEFFGWQFLFLKPAQISRIQSYIGNPAFLASYLFFVMTFAAIIFKEGASKSVFWRRFSVTVGVFAIPAIFLTGTRGAILGLAAALLFLLIYFSVYKRPTPIRGGILKYTTLRSASVVILILLVLLSGLFFFTHNAAIWQKIPGVDRLATIKLFDPGDPSTAFRLITWELSWKAFKEKPIFGWGPENFINAYEAHYDPVYAIHGESWLDRAHNAFLDALVMRGVVGLIIYVGMFIALFYVLFKKARELPPILKAVLGALITGYIVQNLFVFDTIVSYAPLFALLGFLIFNSETSDAQNIDWHVMASDVQKFIGVIIIVLSLYSLYAYNYVPLAQAKTFKASAGASTDINIVIQELKKGMYPYNFAQHNIRAQGIDTVYMGQYFDNPKYAANPNFRPLGDLLIQGIEEIIVREPYDARLFIRLTEMLSGLARAIGPETEEAQALYIKSEGLLKRALEIAPKRQEIYFHLAFTLGLLNRHEESIAVAQRAVDLEPRHSRSQFFLAVAYGLADLTEESRAALKKVEEMNPNFSGFLHSDIKTILTLYNIWGERDNFANLILRTTYPEGHPERVAHTMEASFYEATLQYFALLEKKDEFIQVAQFMAERFPDTKDDMEIFIDLAEKEKWEILRSTF